MEIYGEPVEKLIAKDDKPLSDKDARKEDEKIQKIIDKRKNESDSDRQKRLAKEEKEREDERQFVAERWLTPSTSRTLASSNSAAATIT